MWQITTSYQRLPVARPCRGYAMFDLRCGPAITVDPQHNYSASSRMLAFC
ncbi:hypothetical protein PhaeoP18_03451 [Phaeobacter piscinae]|uniref:Uncharacterized protein n=1 Tax=Phaeobacter piscinae TaxID=1580596 RepID=A0AAN1GUL5_9RHOB|nr:hypothetical protein PhaeoP13_03473 [Phaeobacter piscinae]AUR37669.1 hypothetical protein PhaeoP18_03451 [Phaeobacter piscinae]